MVMGRQDDSGPHRFALRRFARIGDLAQTFDFVVKELNGILWFGSSHLRLPPNPVSYPFFFLGKNLRKAVLRLPMSE
jgi:hypothetical protein